jgi:uncharacterized cupredoxin-like copper-binding protein
LRSRLFLSFVLLALTLVGAACGGGSSTSGGATGVRTIDIEMRDLAYSPDGVTVRAGERVRFVFRNTGQVAHDAYLGDEQAQMDHDAEMSSMGGMHHGGGDAVTVEPGESGELTHTFQCGESVLIGCHQAGHYSAGMRLAVDVT